MRSVRRFGQGSSAWLGTAALLVALAAVCGSFGTASAATAPPLLTYISGAGTKSATTAWLANADGGSPRALGPAGTALLSPDGADVAALNEKGNTSTLSLYPTAGGSPRVVQAGVPFIGLLPGAWSPDSTLLLYTVDGSPEQLMVFSTVTGHAITIATGFFDGASFEPGGQNEIVYALARSDAPNAASNLYITSSSGTGTHQLTRDNHSEWPVWGADAIAYQHLTARKKGQGSTPEWQLWLIKPGGDDPHALTDVNVKANQSGLTPIAFSADGERLLAEFVGTNQYEAYVLDLSGPKVAMRDLTGQGNGTIADAISMDGRVVLLTTYSASNPATHSVETVKWTTGKPTVIVKNGAYASWDQ
jgi:hypothetical protein